MTAQNIHTHSNYDHSNLDYRRRQWTAHISHCSSYVLSTVTHHFSPWKAYHMEGITNTAVLGADNFVLYKTILYVTINCINNVWNIHICIPTQRAKQGHFTIDRLNKYLVQMLWVACVTDSLCLCQKEM